MYEILTRWEIFKSLFEDNPKLVSLAGAKYRYDENISAISNYAVELIDKHIDKINKLSEKNKSLSEQLDECYDYIYKTSKQLSSLRKELSDSENKVAQLEKELSASD